MKTDTARHAPSASRARGRVGDRWEKIIASVLVSRTDAEAAAHAGISTRTLYRLKNDPSFQADLRDAKDAQLSGAIDSLRGNALLYTDTLKAIAEDPKAHANARVRASEVGLTTLLKATELEDILRRLQKLEQNAAEGGK